MYKILLVEDDIDLQHALAKCLAPECATKGAASIVEAKALLNQVTFDLALVDVSLPDGEGFKLCSYMQQQPELEQIPVIFLTGRDEIEDKVMAFSLGAEDYIVKPFHQKELRARVLARLSRRSRNKKNEEYLKIGDLQISLRTQKAILHGGEVAQELDLTPLEFKLLVYLIQNENNILTREQILSSVWGTASNVVDRTVDVHVSNLRKKLTTSTCEIKSIHGEGYRLSIFSQKSES